MSKPHFVILAGLPGVGKTTIARQLSRRMNAFHIRIDSIEQTIKNADLSPIHIGSTGYEVGYQIARDNLLCGNSIIADSVNPLEISRRGWRDCAKGIDCIITELEIFCSVTAIHRTRIENRKPDIPGLPQVTWDQVLKRRSEYEPWENDPTVIDTSVDSVESIIDDLQKSLFQ